MVSPESQCALLCKQVGMVMAKVRASIWPDAPTALLFRAPTVRGLAQEIEAAKGSAAQKDGPGHSACAFHERPAGCWCGGSAHARRPSAAWSSRSG